MPRLTQLATSIATSISHSFPGIMEEADLELHTYIAKCISP